MTATMTVPAMPTTYPAADGSPIDPREVTGPLAPYADALDRALAAFEASKAKLYGTDEQPLYSAAEHQRQLAALRSEEHTSELQSLAYLVCRLLLEKNKMLA